MTTPLTVTFDGGPWDGRFGFRDDDQVPQVICAPGWHRYEGTERVYDDGLLVAITYRYTGQA